MVFLFASCTLTAIALACAQGSDPLATEIDNGVRRTSRERAIRVDSKGETQDLTQGYDDAVRRHIASPQTQGSDDDDAVRRQGRNGRDRGGDADAVRRQAKSSPPQCADECVDISLPYEWVACSLDYWQRKITIKLPQV